VRPDRKNESAPNLPATEDQTIPREVVKVIAMDIGKEVCSYVEVMFPKVAEAGKNSTFMISLRNHIYNEIMASLNLTDVPSIMKRIEDRKRFRRKWKADYRKMRETKVVPDEV
jgi:hypothetical protein